MEIAKTFFYLRTKVKLLWCGFTVVTQGPHKVHKFANVISKETQVSKIDSGCKTLCTAS